MKTIITICFCLLFTGSHFVQAQSKKLFGNWQIAKVGVSLAHDMDMLSDMNNNYFNNAIKGNAHVDYSQLGVSEGDVYSSVCENPNVRLSLILKPISGKNTEWHLSAHAIFDRIDEITYRQLENQDGSTSANPYSFYHFSSNGNEAGVETVYLKYAKFLSIFRLYGGLGMNLGYTFGNHLNTASIVTFHQDFTSNEIDVARPSSSMVSESYDYHKMSDGISHRHFVQAGLGIVLFNRVEFGAEGRLGLGYRYHFGSSPHMSKLISVGLNTRYVF